MLCEEFVGVVELRVLGYCVPRLVCSTDLLYSAQFRSRSTQLMQQSKQGRPDRVGHTQRKNGLNQYASSLS